MGVIRFSEGFARGRRGAKLGQKDVECEALRKPLDRQLRGREHDVHGLDCREHRSGRSHSGRHGTASSTRAFARRALAQARLPVSLLAVGAAALAFVVTFHMGSVRAPGSRAALETMMTMFAFAAAWLLWAQFSSSRRLRDLLLVAAALVLAVTSLAVSAAAGRAGRRRQAGTSRPPSFGVSWSSAGSSPRRRSPRETA